MGHASAQVGVLTAAASSATGAGETLAARAVVYLLYDIRRNSVSRIEKKLV